MKTLRNLICIGACVLASSLSVHATPYASEISVSSGTVSFYLNEAIGAGGSVIVTFEDNSTLSLTGTAAVGLNSFSLTQGAITHTSYSIAVKKIGAGTPTQISSDANTYSQWPSPRGVDVYTNPKNSYFGRIYVGNSTAGTKGHGLFILNADQSTEAGGTTGLQSAVFANSSTSGPYRLGVGGDGNIYVNDLSAASANIYQFDPNLLTVNQVLYGLGVTAGTNAGVHGELVGAPRVTGSTAGNNLVLYTTDYDMAADAGGAGTVVPGTSTLGYGTAAGYYNNVNVYNIGGAAFPWHAFPNFVLNCQVPSVATLVDEVDLGSKSGNIYVMNYRLSYAAPDLEVFDSTGLNAPLWSSQTSGSSDYFNPAMTGYGSYVNGTTPSGSGTAYAAGSFAPYSMRVSPDEKFVACGLINNPVYIMNLNNGIPDPTTLQIIPNYPNLSGNGSLRGIAWDAADNIYVVSSGQALMRIYSLGLTTIALTGNDNTGLNGTFSFTTPSVTATVGATTAQAYQANNSYLGGANAAVPGVFTINLNVAQSSPTTVTFSLGGTAVPADYTLSTSASTYNLTGPVYSVTFPGDSVTTSETVSVTPTASPAVAPPLSVIMSLISGAGYSAISPSVATVSIANSGTPTLSVGAVTYPTMYRGTAGDYAGFQITRLGDTNLSFSVPSSAFSYTGSTAVQGVDFTTAVPSINVNAGDLTETAEVSGPISTAYPFTFVGNESIVVTLSAAAGYAVTAPLSATMTLLDNANPPEVAIWSDPLTDPTDTQWDLAFGSDGNGTALNPVITVVNNYNQSTGPENTGVANDYEVDFGVSAQGYDGNLSANPPSGASTVLHVTVNKIGVEGQTGHAGGVSLYPAGPTGVPMSFGGNYAVRFSEATYEDGGSYDTEFTQWGINHTTNGSITAQWWNGSGGGAGNTNIDGVWYSFDSEQGGAGAGDQLEFTSTSYPNTGWTELASQSFTGFATVFKHPPYTSSGTGDFSGGFGAAPDAQWNDVELRQFHNVITLFINKTVIFSYNNAAGLWKRGDLMLGYCDPFDSVGGYGEAFYSNVRVVSLNPHITSVSLTGGHVVIPFTSQDFQAVTTSFQVWSCSTAYGTYAPVSPAATITGSLGSFSASVPYTGGPAKFYIIYPVSSP